jgi:putative flavoprotein involved in K+ transport
MASQEAWFTFETLVSRGKGLLRLRDGKAWTLWTTIVELKGFEEAKGERRPKGVEHGSYKGRKTWKESRDDDELKRSAIPSSLMS